MRIALSGSSGLIGGSLYNHIIQTKEVIRIGRRSNCEIQADFSIPETMAAMDLKGCDAMVHCAGAVDEDFSVNPKAAYIQNTLVISELLKIIVECKVKRFIYFSTAHVYGTLKDYISEKNVVNPLSDYAISHYAAEQIIRRYSNYNTFKALILRPCAVFGIPDDMKIFHRWSLIPFSFPLEAVYNQKIALRTAGIQQRNFISTGDLSLYVEKFLESEYAFGVLNIVNPIGPQTLSVYEFAVKCADVYKSITGQNCIVIRPEPLEKESFSELVYDSLNKYHHSVNNLEDYLANFMKLAIEAWKENRRYGLQNIIR